MKNNIKVVHVINGLGAGGAEKMLFKILSNSKEKNIQHTVVSLMDEGIYGKKIKDLGIQLICLEFNSKRFISGIYKLNKIVKESDIVDSWLYHSDFIGYFIAKKNKKKIIWNIRHSNLDRIANKARTMKIIGINARLSNYVDTITFNSEESLKNHVKAGYNLNNYEIIENGFDKKKYFNYKINKDLNKQMMNINEEKILITIGRWNIQKDYQTLLKSLNLLERDDYKLIMIGKNLDQKNKELVSLIKEFNLENNVILLGQKENVLKYLYMSDIYISSSLGESYSNAIAEAVLMDLFCVVTDVGASSEIVGKQGITVKPNSPTKLSIAINQALIEYKKCNVSNEKEINDIKDTTKLYENLYYELMRENL